MEDARKDQKSRAGFTLVELVVVIAILGILAGVAYAGYGGYIKYAKGAGDNDLIAAVNLAFASACEDQGIARTDMVGNDAQLVRGTGQTISGVKNIKVKGIAIADQEGFKAAFNRYFAGNTNEELRKHKVGDINFANGTDLFVLDGLKFRNDAFLNSSFGSSLENVKSTLEDLGFLSFTVNDVFSERGVLATEFGMHIGNFGQFKATLSDLMKGMMLRGGLDKLGLGALNDINSPEFQAFAQEYGLTDSSDMQHVANAFMLYASKSATDATKTEESMTKAVDEFLENKQSNKTLNFLMTAGQLEAYYQSEYASPEFKEHYQEALKDGRTRELFDPDNENSLYNELQRDSRYSEYKESGKQKQDLYGFLAGLSAINDNADVLKNDDSLKTQDAFSSLEETFKSVFDITE